MVILEGIIFFTMILTLFLINFVLSIKINFFILLFF